MRQRTLALSVALAAAALAGGCATGRGTTEQEDGLQAQNVAQETATVHVANNNWQDVDVYAVRNGQRLRLGMVTSMGSTDFRLPPYFLVGSPQVQLFIHPIGSNGGYTSQAMLVGAGQRVDLRVENNINLTSYSVW